MARTTINVPPEVRDVLKGCPITCVNGTEWHLELMGQLSRPLYEATNKVLLAAGGKWNRGAKAHVFTKDPTEVLLGAVESGAITDAKKVFQSYYTPSALADEIVAAANIETGMTVLEPSCGMGSIADAVKQEVGYYPDCVELNPEAVVYMRAKNAQVWEGDFVEWAHKTPNRYDRIVMNPPFTANQDIMHVCAAMLLLKPGGRLVAIMSPHWTFADDMASKSFRSAIGCPGRVFDAWSHANGNEWVQHPEGSFAAAGTSVATGHLIYNRPVQATVIQGKPVAKRTLVKPRR